MGTQGTKRDIVFLSGVRTPFGTFGGTLRDFSAIDLGVFASKAAMAAAHVEPKEIQHAIFGNVMQTTSDTIYYARHVALKSGVPQEVPALTVNRLCGSGFQAVVSGAQEILLDEAEICLVGGGESMSQAPHIARGMRWGLYARQESRARGLSVGGAQGSVRRSGDGRHRGEGRRAVQRRSAVQR